jgi:hypothetical protein
MQPGSLQEPQSDVVLGSGCGGSHGRVAAGAGHIFAEDPAGVEGASPQAGRARQSRLKRTGTVHSALRIIPLLSGSTNKVFAIGQSAPEEMQASRAT